MTSTFLRSAAKSAALVISLVAVESVAGCGFSVPATATGLGGTGGTSTAGAGLAGSGAAGSVSGAAGKDDGSAEDAVADASDGAEASAGTDGSDGDNQVPALLSQTGLFSSFAGEGTPAPGVYPYQPQYALWSDSATKRRWVYLPPGAQIDTSDMAFWVYPPGFRLWKEFTRNDGQGHPVRVETRFIMKRGQGQGDWLMMTFKWKADHTDAVVISTGETNASGTPHYIPTQQECGTCHNAMVDNVLGFSALQLSHAVAATDPGLNLSKVTQMGWLSNPPTGNFKLPGTPAEQAALGYLHANCGLCHNKQGHVYLTSTDLDLWTHVDDPALIASVQATPAYLSTVCDLWPMGADGTGNKFNPIAACPTGHATGAMLEGAIATTPRRVTPRNPVMSAIHELMDERGDAFSKSQMPPVATYDIDMTGLAAVDAWINGLPTH